MVLGGERVRLVYFRTKQRPLLASTDLEEFYQVCVDELGQEIDKYLKESTKRVWIFFTLGTVVGKCTMQ